MRAPRKRTSDGVVGLDVDGSYLSAVTVSGRSLPGAASADLPPGIVQTGEVIDVDALGRELKQFFREWRLPQRAWARTRRRAGGRGPYFLHRLKPPPQRDEAARARCLERPAPAPNWYSLN